MSAEYIGWHRGGRMTPYILGRHGYGCLFGFRYNIKNVLVFYEKLIIILTTKTNQTIIQLNN